MKNKATTEYIQAWFDSTVNGIKSKFEIDGKEIPPFAMCMKKSGQTSILPMLWQTEEDKILFARALKIFSKIEEIVALIFVTEMWFTRRKPHLGVVQNYDTYGRPSEQPDKEEGIMIVCETNLGAQNHLFIIHRDKQRPYLTVADLGTLTGYGGRFSNFLSKPYNTN